MKDAINDFSSDNFDLIWRPFQLNPDMPLEGMERKKYLELKFGGKNNYKNIYKNIYNVGLKNNIYQDDISIYLQSKEDRDNLLAEESHAKELGVTGVPCFIINKEFVLFGAQEKKNFLEIFNSINNVN